MSVDPQIENISFYHHKTTSAAEKQCLGGIKTKLANLCGCLLIVASDLITLSLTLGLAYLTRLYLLPYLFPQIKSINQLALVKLWWFPLLTLAVLAYEGMYWQRLPYWQEAKQTIKAATMAVVLAIIFLFLTKSSSNISRTLIIISYVYCIFLIPISRWIIKVILTKTGLWQKKILIMGAGKTAELVIQGFNREFTMGYRPVGLLEDNPEKLRGIINGRQVIPVLGNFSDIDEVIARTGVQDVVLAAPGMDSNELVQLTNRLQQTAANVMLVPDLFGLPLTSIKADYLFNEKTLILSMRNNLASAWNRFLKRTFDLTVGSVLLALALPVMLLIAVAIKLDSQGPAIFAHRRIGKGGKVFSCLKFRTMVINSQEVLEKLLATDPKIRQEWQREFKLKNDPRITRVGNFLRKTSLDELPQLFNVLLGQMSLVGPRPIITKEIEKYGRYFANYQMVPPGITGLWQVSGRNDINYDERVQLDVWYTRNWSLWLDITLLIRTIGVVLNRKGAY